MVPATHYDGDHARILDWAHQVDTLSYFELLQIPRDFDDARLLDAYHRFAAAFHPDAHPDAPEEVARALKLLFQRGVEAYRALGHPKLRRRYLHELEQGRLRLPDLKPPVAIDLGRVVPELHLCCRSAGAKLAAQKAAKALARGDLWEVHASLELALRSDSDTNLDIQRCLEEVRERLELESADRI